MILGTVFLVEGPPEFRVSLATAIGIALPFAAITVFLTTLVIRTHGNKTKTGVSALVGETNIARSTLNPEGTIFVHGEYWDAVSSVNVAEGTRVRVLSAEGMRVKVEPMRNT